MDKLFKKLVISVLWLQEHLVKKRQQKTFASFKNSTSKTVITKGCSLNLTAETGENKKKLEKNLEVILKKFEQMPAKMLVYIERNGTPVIRHQNAEKILDFINEEQGFIRGLKGFKALILNLFLFKKFSFKTNEMFLIAEGDIDKYAMMHRFYLWYAYKFDMPGFDPKAQENFKKYVNEKGNLNLKNLSTDDIMALKEAIARDVDAIEFVQRIAKNGEGTQNAMKKLSDGGASV